jgi:hypothetical protein
MKTAEVAQLLDLPTTTAERALEDLNAHKLLKREKAGESERSANLWSSTGLARELWREARKPLVQAVSASPDLSHPHALKERKRIEGDISGPAEQAAERRS